MVFAVRCPEPKCRKYMLVEEKDREGVVNCLICKTPIRIGTEHRDEPKPVDRNSPIELIRDDRA